MLDRDTYDYEIPGVLVSSDWKIVKKLAENKIKVLYFRDTNLVKLEENEYIKEVNNWGDIYRYIRENG